MGRSKRTTDQVGDIKIIEKFAWTPFSLTNGRIVWLCKYNEVWEYKELSFAVNKYNVNAVQEMINRLDNLSRKIIKRREWRLLRTVSLQNSPVPTKKTVGDRYKSFDENRYNKDEKQYKR